MSEVAFRVGFVEGAMPDKWARTWRERRRDPIELVPVSQAEQEDGMRSGSLDMALVRLPIDRDGLHCIPLYDEVAVAVAASRPHLAAADEVVHADMRRATRWTGRRSRPRTRWPVVANGDGVAVMPMSLARLHHRKDAIYRPVTDLPPDHGRSGLAVDNDDERVQTFIGIVRGRTDAARASRPRARATARRSRAGGPRGSRRRTGRRPRPARGTPRASPRRRTCRPTGRRSRSRRSGPPRPGRAGSRYMREDEMPSS